MTFRGCGRSYDGERIAEADRDGAPARLRRVRSPDNATPQIARTYPDPLPERREKSHKHVFFGRRCLCEKLAIGVEWILRPHESLAGFAMPEH